MALIIALSILFPLTLLSQSDVCIWGRLDYNARINGLYKYEGLHNNKAYYIKSEGCYSFYIYWNKLQWNIHDVLGSDSIHAYCNKVNDIFDCNEWNIWDGTLFSVDSAVFLSENKCPSWECNAVYIPSLPNSCDIIFNQHIGDNLWSDTANKRYLYFNPWLFEWQCDESYEICSDLIWAFTYEGWVDIAPNTSSVSLHFEYPLSKWYTVHCIQSIADFMATYSISTTVTPIETTTYFKNTAYISPSISHSTDHESIGYTYNNKDTSPTKYISTIVLITIVVIALICVVLIAYLVVNIKRIKLLLESRYDSNSSAIVLTPRNHANKDEESNVHMLKSDGNAKTLELSVLLGKEMKLNLSRSEHDLTADSIQLRTTHQDGKDELQLFISSTNNNNNEKENDIDDAIPGMRRETPCNEGVNEGKIQTPKDGAASKQCHLCGDITIGDMIEKNGLLYCCVCFSNDNSIIDKEAEQLFGSITHTQTDGEYETDRFSYIK